MDLKTAYANGLQDMIIEKEMDKLKVAVAPCYIKEVNSKLTIELLRQTDSFGINIVDKNHIVAVVYHKDITLDELRAKNEYFSIIKDLNKVDKFLRKIFDNNNYNIEKNSQNDSYNLVLQFTSGVEEEELYFEIYREKMNLINENKKIELSLDILYKNILKNEEDIQYLKNKYNSLENNLNSTYKKKIDILEKEINLVKKEKNELVQSLKDEKNKKKETKKENKIKAAKESFERTNILSNDEKVLLSEWIDPNKIFRFKMLYSTNIDGSSCSTFHYNCDGVFPTITIVRDTNGNKFGGYTTTSWGQSNVSSDYARDQDAFTFDITRKKKYVLTDKFSRCSIYRNNNYGPTFGDHFLYISNSCTSNSSSYTNTRPIYNSSCNLLGNSGTTYFQVSYYEVYKVIQE